MDTETEQTESRAQGDGVALVVDLDGTLTRADTFHEGLVALLTRHPLELINCLRWWRQGKAQFKRQVAERGLIDATLLPYDEAVLARVRAARAEGRRTVLATAADGQIAQAVSDHLGCFDDIVSTDGERNLSGTKKRDTLVDRFGEGGFDYIGNAGVDKPVWAAARTAILANVPAALADEMKRRHGSVEVLSVGPGIVRPLVKAARLYQWVKNALIFIPILAGQQLTAGNLALGLLAFLCFGMAASSVYLVNDMTDLRADRIHPRKRNRPFAAGHLSLLVGLGVAAALLVLSLAVGLLISPVFELVLLGYLFVTSNYSLWIKRYALIDVIVLAGLYTLRIIAGGAATGIPLTLWLLGFSMFLFTSLAFAKRYTEVADMVKRGESATQGRGYRAGDQEVLIGLGTASGMAAVVTLALYVGSPTDPGLYRHPEFLWGVCPILMYWIGRIWLAAKRGALTDDPIVFAFRDRVSRWIFILTLVPIALAVWV